MNYEEKIRVIEEKVKEYGLFLLGSVGVSLKTPPLEYFQRNPYRLLSKIEVLVSVAKECIDSTSAREGSTTDKVTGILKDELQKIEGGYEGNMWWTYFLVGDVIPPENFELKIPFSDALGKVYKLGIFDTYPFEGILRIIETLAKVCLKIKLEDVSVDDINTLNLPPESKDLLKRIKGHLNLLNGDYHEASIAYNSVNPELGFFFHEEEVLSLKSPKTGELISSDNAAFDVFAKYADSIDYGNPFGIPSARKTGEKLSSSEREHEELRSKTWWRFPEKSRSVVGLVEKFASRKLAGFSSASDYLTLQNFLSNPVLSGKPAKLIREMGAKKSNKGECCGGREKSRVKTIEGWLRKAPPGGLLDIGGGDGGIANEIVNVTPRDIIVFEAYLIPKHPKITYVQNINGIIPYPDGHFAVVLIYVALHHFDKDLDILLKEAYRVCKKDGLLVIREHDISEGEANGYTKEEVAKYLNWVHFFYELAAKRSPYTTTPYDYRTAGEWKTKLEFVGFSFVEHSYTPNMFFTYEELYIKKFPESSKNPSLAVPIPSFVKELLSKVGTTSLPNLNPTGNVGDPILNEEFMKIETLLNKSKTKLDTIPPKDYHTVARQMDFYADLKVALKKFGLDVVTNATIKMLEMCVVLGLDYSSRFSNAELPGAFIMAMHYYEITKLNKESVVWFASSFLDSTTRGADNTMLEDQYGLYKNYPTRWLMGPNSKAIPENVKTSHKLGPLGIKGDLLGTEDISVMIDTIKTLTNGKGIELYTSDAGIDVTSDYNKQEEMTLRLNYGQVICGLGCLAKGGSMITKQYTFFNPLSRFMLYQLSKDFDQLYVVKPKTSRSINSEVYIYAKGYLRSPSDFVIGVSGDSSYQNLRRVFVRMGRTNKPQDMWKELDEEISIPKGFDQQILKLAKELAETQISYIDFALSKWNGESIIINKSEAMAEWMRTIRPTNLPSDKKLKINFGTKQPPPSSRGSKRFGENIPKGFQTTKYSGYGGNGGYGGYKNIRNVRYDYGNPERVPSSRKAGDYKNPYGAKKR